jgi:hypothetical protein
MTTKEVTFFYEKTPASWRCLSSARQGSAWIKLPAENAIKATAAMTDLFDRLVKTKAENRTIFQNLGDFSVIIFPQPACKLEIISQEERFVFNSADKIAASFLASLPANNTPAVVPYQGPIQNDNNAVSPETLYKSLMEALFSNNIITRSDQQEESFGKYLTERVLGKPGSCKYDIGTGKFTLVYLTEKRIPLKNLPGNKSPDSLAILQKMQGATLRIPKVLEGQINIAEGKLSFEPGSLMLEWKWDKAQLLGIFANAENNPDNTIQLQIKYINWTGISGTFDGVTNAQDFVDFAECNLTSPACK